MTLRWRKAGEAEWKTITAHAKYLEPSTLRRLVATPDGTLLGCTEPYGVFFSYDPKTRTSEHLGSPMGNVYDLLCDGDTAYISGYARYFATYKRTKPWPLSPGSEREDTNPKVWVGWGLHNCFMDIGVGGKVFVGGVHRRHSSGGEIGIYGPATGERTSLREEFQAKRPYDLVTINGGRRVVVSWTDELVVLDAATHEITNRWPMPAGAILAGNLFDGGPDRVVCVTAQKVENPADERMRFQFTDNPGMVYCVNVATGEVVYKHVLKDRVFAGTIRELNRRMRLGPDGCGWFFVLGADDRTYLARIHPGDGTVEKVIETGFAGHLCFMGDDLYLYNGGEGTADFTTLKRIRSVFRR